MIRVFYKHANSRDTVSLPHYTKFDEYGTAQIFDIVPLRTHRLTYRQTDTLKSSKFLHRPMLFKMRVAAQQQEELFQI